jgi:hypothetical protein
MHPYHHALSSAKKHGGRASDYQHIHDWFDATKAFFGDARHRALRHHTAGIFWCEHEYGSYVTNSAGKDVPVRVIAEQHVMEDMGFLPTPEWWLLHMRLVPTMNKVPTKPHIHPSLMRDIEEIRDELTKQNL